MTDRDLLDQFVQRHSQEAFATLVQRYTGLVYGTCFRILNESHAAEDAAQCTFLVLMRKAAGISSDVVLAGWLHRAAELSARDLLKSAKRRSAHEQEAASMERQSSFSDLDWSVLQPELDAALATLPDEQRDTVVLRYLHGFSHAQLAAEFNCPKETVHTRLNRAMGALRERLMVRRIALSLTLLSALMETHVRIAAPATLSQSIQQNCMQQFAAPSSSPSFLRQLTPSKVWLPAAGIAALLAVGFSLFSKPVKAPVRSIAMPVPSLSQAAARVEIPQPKPAPAAASAVQFKNLALKEIRHANSAEKAIFSSLDWLSKIQEKDGHFDGANFGAIKGQDVAVTSLALLSYLGSGNSAKVGDYTKTVRQAVEWLKSNPSTEITQSALRVLALTEHAAFTNIDREIAQREVDLLVAKQHREGVWLEPGAQGTYANVIEPTTWSVFAIKSAKISGLKTSPLVVTRATDWLRNYSEPAAWDQNAMGENDMLCRTSLFNARSFLGERAGAGQLTAGLLDHKPAYNPDGLGIEIITWYQGSIAAFNNDQQWAQWSPAMRHELVSNQIATGDFAGSWNVRESSENFKWGRIGATALGALNLEIYYRYQALTQKPDKSEPPPQPGADSMGNF